jgi:hypothetical protein
VGYYGVIFPEFWTGHTGRELRAHGKDAQLLGLYLATNRHTNMIGLYRLLVDDIRHETGLGLKAIERGCLATAATNYAYFDAESSFVWVRQMVRFRLNLKAGGVLDAEDHRVLAVNRIYHAIDPNPFLGEFFDANQKMLRLRKRRDSTGLVVPLSGHHNMSSLEGAYQGACKPDTEIRIRDQKQVQIQKKARLTPQSPNGKNTKVIRALVRDVLKASPGAGFADLKELTKTACASHAIAYDAEAVGSALEQALARRQA